MAPLCLLSTILIITSIGVSPILTWNPDIHRYESYDLEKGPVFYEAYYPDANEESSRPRYQEKRYFDRGAVLERTYQVPSPPSSASSSENLPYAPYSPPENNIRSDNYQGGDFLQNGNHFAGGPNLEPLDIKEISNLARRAISRDLENWNTLENYLDRAKYQDVLYRRRVIPETGYRLDQSARGIKANLADAAKQQSDFRRDIYEEVREEPLALANRVFPGEDQRESIRRLSTRDLRRDLGLRPVPYTQTEPLPAGNAMKGLRTESSLNGPLGSNANPLNVGGIIRENYPTEDIYAPRPQVINYIFSKKPEVVTKKAQSLANAGIQSIPVESEKQDIASESLPRNYGDNLIRDEIKKSEEDKDVKVTSIEVSEVPRHKTRHHHGEWPKRDYSHRHQSQN